MLDAITESATLNLSLAFYCIFSIILSFFLSLFTLTNY